MYVTSNKMFNFIDGACEGILRKLFRGNYPLQPIFVQKAIDRAITENTKVFKDGVLPPNRVRVLLNRDDYEDFKKIEGIYTGKLEQSATTFIENEFKGQAMGVARPVIVVEAAPDVVKGDVKIMVEHYEASYGISE